MPVRIIVNGKTYNSFADAINVDQLEDFFINGIIENIYNSTKTYVDEANRKGGNITFGWKNNQLTISGTNVSEDLITKIQNAISQ